MLPVVGKLWDWPVRGFSGFASSGMVPLDWDDPVGIMGPWKGVKSWRRALKIRKEAGVGLSGQMTMMGGGRCGRVGRVAL